MKKILGLSLLVLGLTGCATTYKAPITLNQSASEQVQGTKEQYSKQLKELWLLMVSKS
jgi:hypothetical protein